MGLVERLSLMLTSWSAMRRFVISCAFLLICGGIFDALDWAQSQRWGWKWDWSNATGIHIATFLILLNVLVGRKRFGGAAKDN